MEDLVRIRRMERLVWCDRESMIWGSLMVATEPVAARRRWWVLSWWWWEDVRIGGIGGRWGWGDGWGVPCSVVGLGLEGWVVAMVGLFGWLEVMRLSWKKSRFLRMKYAVVVKMPMVNA